jgi:hypothetical protein
MIFPSALKINCVRQELELMVRKHATRSVEACGRIYLGQGCCGSVFQKLNPATMISSVPAAVTSSRPAHIIKGSCRHSASQYGTNAVSNTVDW